MKKQISFMNNHTKLKLNSPALYTYSRSFFRKLFTAIKLLDPKSVVLINISKIKMICGSAKNANTDCASHV